MKKTFYCGHFGHRNINDISATIATRFRGSDVSFESVAYSEFVIEIASGI